ANAGVNDASAVAANQAEIDNALNTIDGIAHTTKFGASKYLLNGQAGVTAAVTGSNNGDLGALRAGVGASAGAHTVAITQGTGGAVSGAAGAGVLPSPGPGLLTRGGLNPGLPRNPQPRQDTASSP